jgi:hypothetical protein
MKILQAALVLAIQLQRALTIMAWFVNVQRDTSVTDPLAQLVRTLVLIIEPKLMRE